MARRAPAAGLTLLAAVWALAPGCRREAAIVVGAKNFTEQAILGEIAAQQIERRLATTVTRKLDLGGTALAHKALAAGYIDLYPEYTGTALRVVLRRPLPSDRREVFREVADAYRETWKLAWLAPLGFDDTFAMVIRGRDARDGGIATLGDAAKRKEPWKLGVGYEFLERPDGLKGLMRTYDLPLKGTPWTMDLGLLYEALEHGDVDMVAANATDGQLSALDVVALRDDKGYFPPYEAAYVAREETLAREPRLRAALEELSGKITSERMRAMNHEVSGARRRAADVAREFLATLP